MVGYSHFEKEEREELREKLLKLSPVIEKNVMIPKRGITLKDLEKEIPDYEKCKKAALNGFMDGNILKNYSGVTFKDKYEDYLYNAGINQCKWIKETSHDEYFHTLLGITFKVISNVDLSKKIWNYCLSKLLSYFLIRLSTEIQ